MAQTVIVVLQKQLELKGKKIRKTINRAKELKRQVSRGNKGLKSGFTSKGIKLHKVASILKTPKQQFIKTR